MPASISQQSKTARAIRGKIPIASALLLALALSACTNTFSSVRTQGYEISDSALAQVRTGQSQDLVVAVMGSPQTQGTFGDVSAFYYVETKVEKTRFGLSSVLERTVLAVYFGADKKVTDKAIYTLQDGRVFAVESTRTASYGADRTFVEQILASF